MTDRETLDKARALFTGATQGDTLARRLIEMIELRDLTIVAEVEHSQRLEDKLRACDEIAFRNAR